MRIPQPPLSFASVTTHFRQVYSSAKRRDAQVVEGNLIGIPTSAAIDPEFNTLSNGVGFAIPSNHVQRTVSQIIASWQGS